MDPSPVPYINTQKWEKKDLNMRAKTTNLLKEKIGINLCDLRLCNGFLDMIHKAQVIKEKVEKIN